MSHSLTKNSPESSTQHHDRYVEEKENHSSASASAGLNLNLSGALSGAFSSKSKKETQRNPDGSSRSVEEKHDIGTASGGASGRGQGFVEGRREDGVRAKKEVDHLGIES